MTVCIAVICANSMVMGMSERMLAAGDVQFQPSTSKTRDLTTSIVMMSSGDAGTRSEIFNDAHKQAADELRRNSTTANHSWFGKRQWSRISSRKLHRACRRAQLKEASYQPGR
jgi:hypothetical protein